MACKGNSAVYVRICSGNSEGKYALYIPGMVTTNSSVLKWEM